MSGRGTLAQMLMGGPAPDTSGQQRSALARALLDGPQPITGGMLAESPANPRGLLGEMVGQYRAELRGESPMGLGLNTAMGFGLNPAMMKVFHGSFAPNLTKLDNARLGENFPNRASRQGHWFSTNADDAAFYGDNVYQAEINGRFANLPSMETMGATALDKLRNIASDPKVSFEARQRAEKFVEYIEQTRDPAFFTNVAGAHINKTRRAGNDGARLAGGETVQNSSAAGDNYVVFNPELISLLGKLGE